MVRPGVCWGLRRASGRTVEIRTDAGVPLAASPTHEQRLKVGKPDIIRPSITTDCGPMAAPIIRAVNQQAVNASGLGEGDLPLAGGAGMRRLTL